jgi:hypothetical protein
MKTEHFEYFEISLKVVLEHLITEMKAPEGWEILAIDPIRDKIVLKKWVKK